MCGEKMIIRTFWLQERTGRGKDEEGKEVKGEGRVKRGREEERDEGKEGEVGGRNDLRWSTTQWLFLGAHYSMLIRQTMYAHPWMRAICSSWLLC